MKINLLELGFVKTETVEAGFLKRTYTVWKHPTNWIEIQGYADDLGGDRPWTAGVRREDGSFKFLTGKDYKKRRYGATVKGAIRCWSTASAAAQAALKEYAPDLLKPVAKRKPKADH